MFMAVILAAWQITQPIQAATFYWDTDGSDAGNAVVGTSLGGTGTWDIATSNWWPVPSGALTTWSNTNADIAIFSGPFSALPTLNTVTLSGALTANQIQFWRSGYTLTGGTSLTLAGANAGLYAQVAETATISSLLAGSDGLLKTGGGSVRLSNPSNSYTGTTTIAGGSLIINSAAALGGTGAVNVTAGNGTPSNVLVLGFTGGSLVLDGSTAGFTLSRDLNLEGRGPRGQNGAALLSTGNNTLSGVVSTASSTQTPATFRNTQLSSANGTLTLSGTLNVLGTAGTTITTLGGGNVAGVGNYNLTGVLSGTGTLEKTGGGTLFLNPSDTSGFAGRFRVSSSAAIGQSSVRITSLNVLGTANSGTTSAPVDLNGGTLEIRSNSSLNFGKNVYQRASSTIFVGPAVGGSAVNGTVTFGNMSFEDNITNTFNSRNGYGVSFTTAPVNGGDNGSTITNNMGGTLSFTGNFWSNADNAANRTMTIAGNGNTVINGNVIASAAAFNHGLAKTGSGALTITGTGSTLDGGVSVQGSLIITDFRSITNNTSSITLGNTTTTAGNLIIGTATAATAGGLTTSKPIILATTTASNSIYANQSVAEPVVLNGGITMPATTSASLILGGTNTEDNIINTAIPTGGGASPSNGLVKTGSGTWVLNAANAYSGATTIQNGTLKLRATAASSNVILEAGTNTVVFGANATTGTAGGILEFRGFTGASTTETLGALTPTAGAATVRLLGNGGAANLTFTSLGATTAASSVNFDTSSASGGVITLTGQAATTATTLPGTANFLGHLYINGANFATINGSAQVVAPTYAGAGDFQNAASALVSAVHNKLTGSFTSGALTISSLVTNSQTLALSGNLVVSTGGILQSGGTATIQSDSGTARLINGTGTAGRNIAIRVDQAGDVLNLGTLTNPVNIASFTTGGMTKNGAGLLDIYGTNAQTGTTNINEGTVRLSGAAGRLSATSANLVIRQGAILELNGTTAANATVAALDGTGIIKNIDASAATFTQTGAGTWAGIFQDGAGVLNVTKAGTTGAPVWSGLNTYTGVTTIGGTTGSVTVDVLADGGVPSGIGASSNAASNLIFSGTTAGIIYRGNINEGALTLGSRSATTDRLFTLSGSGATLTSDVTNNNAIVWSNTGAIVHGTDANRTLTFAGTSQGDNTFNPQLTDSTGFVTSVTKTGTGIWRLGNSNNTYSGPTVITQGILMATNNEGLSASSNLQFNGGTLYSQGTFNRNIGTAAGEMQFLAPAANTAQFSGGFLGGDSKLTVDWAGTPVWGGGSGFLDTRNGLLLNGSQAQAQGATGSNALSEVEIAGDFSLGTASPAGGSALSFTLAQNSSTVSGLASTAGLVVGQSFTGTNVPSGAYIVSVNSATQITLSANTANTGGIAGTYTNGAFVADPLRAIRVDDNTQTGADFATISGVISAGDAVTGIRKLGSGTLRLTGANTYQGETNVNQGALAVRSLGFSGSAGTSSVGAVTVAAFTDANAVTLGNGGTGGAILQYIGAGETTNRKIRLNSTTGSIQIHADGAGPLILTNVANDMVAGAKTLFLRGTNNDGNMITSQLSDNGGVLSVTIDSNATWILANSANNYTGTTTVSAGALGIGHDTAIGGAITNSNGNIFAYGGDRTVSNTMTMGNNANWGFLGDYNLTFSNAVLGSSANSNILINSISAGKALTFTGLVANALTGTRNFTVDGPGETIINGNFTTSTAFGVQIIKTGDGTLTLGGDGTVSNWNQVGTGMDLDRGTVKFITNNAINTTAGYAGITLSPELTESDTATIDLNGTSQTVNAFTAAAAATGAVIIDNTAATAATLTLGANNATVSITNTGARTITDSGTGALSIVKTGNTAAVLPTGMTLTYQGTTSSTGGGSLTINSALNGTSGLVATGSSTLALPGGLTAPGVITAVEVGGGSTLSLVDGTGSAIANLTTLNLGAGSGTATLNLNVGDQSTAGDYLNTDTLTLLTGGTLSLANTITFNLTDAGLNPSTTYTLLNVVDGGIAAFGIGNMIQGATPGGFSGFTWFVDNNVVQITTGTLITGSFYWRGLTDNTWNANANNWSTDKAGTIPAVSIPGSGSDVVFAYDGIASAPLTTTLEQNIKINSLTFESGTTTPTSVTIAPGAVSTNRLEVAPQVATDGIKITAGGPPAVTISAPLRLGNNQTWNVAGSTSVLTLSGGLQGEKDVTQTGAGKVIVSTAADNAFNSGNTADFTVNGGSLEIQSIDSLGVTGKRANVAVNTGGAFYYNNATAGTVTNNLMLGGGTLSAGGNGHTYSGTVNVSGNSFINMADSNGPASNTARSITLSGVVSGSGSLTIDSNSGVSSGNQLNGTLTMNNAGNTWTGDLNFNEGTATLASAVTPAFATNNVIFNAFGRLNLQGLNSQTLTRSGTLSYAAGAIGEFGVDNTSGTSSADFLVDQNGLVSLGAGGTGGNLRVYLADAFSKMNITGGVTLGGNSSISVGGDALGVLEISSVISDGGSGYALAINDDFGGWGTTNRTARLTSLNTFSGNFALGEGVAEFNTVTGISGAASSLGQGTAITIGGGTLRFIGSASQTTDRAISTTASSTLSANGTSGAKITYTGAITQALDNSLTLSGAAGSEGEITAGINQAVGTASDLTVNGGTWTLSGAASTISDDVVVSGTTTILNLNTAGVLVFGTSTGNLLQITNGGIVNLGASGTMTGFADTGVYIAQSAGGAEAVLNMNSFNQTFLRLILGERLADRSGRIDGTGTLTIDGATGIELYRGTINANLASTAATPFNKYGPGIVTLKGDNSGIATTSAAIINEGTLVLDYTASNTTKLRAASVLDMRGADLTLIGNAGAATAQTVASFTLGSGGNNVITLTGGAGQEIVLNMNAITRAVNSQDGTIRFNLPTGTQSATNGITTDTLNTIGTAPNAILGAWATVTDGSGTFFARNVTNAADGNIGAAVTTLQDAVGSWLAGENISDSTGFTGTVTGSFINSLRLNAAGGSALNVATNGVLGINSGGILITGNVTSSSSISGGTLFSGTVAATPEVIVTHGGASVFEISSDIRVNHQVFKTGTGTLVLGGNNIYTGLTEIQNGTLQLNGGNAIGDTSIVTLSGARDSKLELLSNETIGRLQGGRRNDNSDYGMVDVGSNTLTINQSANTTYAGRFSGSGTIVLNAGNTGNLNYAGQSSTGLFTGSVIVSGGLLQLSGATARLGSASSFTINGGGNFLLDNNDDTNVTDRLSDTAIFTLNSAAGSFSGETRPRGFSNRNNDNDNATETYGSLVLNSGASYVSMEASGGTSAQAGLIAAIGWTRSNAATINVRGRNLGGTANERAQFKVADANDAAMIAANVGGGGVIGGTAKNVSIIPWAIGENLTTGLADANMGNTFLSYVDNRGFVPLSLTSEFSIFSASTAGDNVRESLGADLTGIAGTTVNSLILDNTAFAGLDVTGTGAGQTLAITSGALMFTVTGGVASTAYDTTLGGFDGGITVGSTNEYVISVVNPSSATTSSTLTANIASPLTSSADITKSGRGTLVLNQVNTAGGGANKTTLNEGTLQIADLDNIGGNTGGLVFAGGTLRLGAGLTDDISTRAISFLLGGGTLDTNGIDLTLANSLGSGAGAFTKIGAGNLTLNATATRTGATTLTDGTITIGATNALGVGGNLSIGAGSTLALGANNISQGLVTTSGASPAITGTGTITASTGFFFNHTGDTTIDAILAGGGGLLKAQANIVTLNGLNTYAGTTEVQAGTLSFNSITNVGGGASALGNASNAETGIIRMGLTTAATTLQYTGTGHSSNRVIGMQGTTGSLTLDADGTGALVLTGGVRFEMAGNKTLVLRGSSDASTIDNAIGGLTELGGVLTLNKTDGNTWVVNGGNNYTGATQVDNGTLKIGANDALSTAGAVRIGTGTTAGTLDLNGFDQTIGSLSVQSTSNAVTNNIIVDTGKTLTINGAVTLGIDANAADTNINATGGGSIVVNSGGSNFIVGAATGGTNDSRVDADFSGLANFTANLGAGTFRLGDVNTGTEVNPSTFKLAVNNTITAASFRVGDGAGGSATHTLTLGSGTNLLNANTINIGSAAATIRSGGAVIFEAGDTTGTLTVRAADGIGRATLNMINTTGSTAGDMSATLDLTGHTADLLLSTLTLASRTTGTGDATGTLTFDQGTLDVTTLNMASRTGGGSGSATATLNLGDSAAPGTPTATIGALNMAVHTSTGTPVEAVTANVNITGGNVTIGTGSGTAVNMANASSGRTVTSSMVVTGGTVEVTGNIVRTGGAGTENASVTLNGGTLDMNGNSIGSGSAIIPLNAQSGTLRNLGELNGGGTLTKTTAGVLVLEGPNTHTGRTVIDAGKLSISDETNLGANPSSLAADQLTLNGGTLLTTANLTIDDSNRGITVSADSTIETAVGTTATISSTILGGAALSKEGAGTLIFTAVQTGLTGAVTVNGGTLAGLGGTGGDLVVASSGTLSPGVAGTPGAFTVTGSLTVSTGGTLATQIGGATTNAAAAVLAELNANGNLLGLVGSVPSAWENYLNGTTAHSHTLVSGTASAPAITGTVALLGGYSPVYGDVFDILDWGFSGAMTSTPSAFDFGGITLGSGLAFNTDLFASNGIVVVVPEPSRALFLMLGLLGLMLRRRRK